LAVSQGGEDPWNRQDTLNLIVLPLPPAENDRSCSRHSAQETASGRIGVHTVLGDGPAVGQEQIEDPCDDEDAEHGPHSDECGAPSPDHDIGFVSGQVDAMVAWSPDEQHSHHDEERGDDHGEPADQGAHERAQRVADRTGSVGVDADSDQNSRDQDRHTP